MSRGILEGKQVIAFSNTTNHGRVCLFFKNYRRSLIVMLSFDKFTSL